jgi:propionyl-CoA synthetase
MKGHLPFAFITLNEYRAERASPATPPKALFTEINNIVRNQIGAIASLGGIVQGSGMIPKTRSGKTLRRCLRQLVETASKAIMTKKSTCRQQWKTKHLSMWRGAWSKSILKKGNGQPK